MGCITLPLNLCRAILWLSDWLKEVDDNTENIQKVYGTEVARKYKRQCYIGFATQCLVTIILLGILGLIIKLLFL